MDAGLFRDRITFYYSVKNADGYGGFTVSAGGSMETLWGYVTPDSGNYVDNNGKRSKQRVKEIIIRLKDWDLLNDVDNQNNEITFSISGESGTYRVNNAFESTKNEYVTIQGTTQL